MSGPIIVLGAPRSGTTYLVKLLNSHPDVNVSNETRLLVFLHETLALTEDDRACFKYRKEFQEFIRPVLANSIAEFQQQLGGSARFWGDKNPHYADPANRPVLQLAADLFPDARFIHIIRDGRAVVTSLMRKGWESFDSAHTMWPAYVRSASDFGRHLPAERFLEIRHEDLVADDLGGAAAVFEFLMLPVTPGVKRFCSEQAERRVPINDPTSSLDEPPTAAWSRLFDPARRARSATLLKPTLLKYGYPVADEDPSCSNGGGIRVSAQTLGVDRDGPVLVAGGVSDAFLLNISNAHQAWHFPARADNVFDQEKAQSTDALRSELGRATARGAHWLLVPNEISECSVDLTPLLQILPELERVRTEEQYTLYTL